MIARRVRPGLLLGVVVVALAAVVQAGFVTHATVGAARPDLILLLALDWALLRGVEEGMLWGFAGGFVVDLSSGLPFGTSSAAYVAVAGSIMLGERALARYHLLLPVITAVLATGVYYLVAFFVVSSVDEHFLLSWDFLRTVAGVAVFNAIVNLVVFRLLQSLEGRMWPVARATL